MIYYIIKDNKIKLFRIRHKNAWYKNILNTVNVESYITTKIFMQIEWF